MRRDGVRAGDGADLNRAPLNPDSVGPITGANLAIAPLHSAAVAWLEAGVHITAVADLLGHSSIAVTGDIYGHTSDDTARAAIDHLSGALGL
jgi:hypothetical protein